VLNKRRSSLTHQAELQQAQYKDTNLFAARARSAMARISASLTSPGYGFFWLLLLGLAGVLFFPSQVYIYKWPLNLSLFGSATEAAEFIKVLWQVAASVLALSIAVIIFAFQSVPSSRYGIKLHEFARDTHLFPIFYWGIVGLLVDLLVLLGIGKGAPAGGAGSWAVFVSGSSLLFVAVVFTRTVRALDPDRLHSRRLERLRKEVDLAVEREILERIAYNLLQEKCEKAGIRLAPMSVTSLPTGAKAVTAPRSGQVRDIDLQILEELTTGAAAHNGTPSHFELRVYLGMKVLQGHKMLVLPSSADEIMEKAKRVVRLEEGASADSLAEAAERLHEEARVATRDGSPARYADAVDAYEAALFAFPEAWQRYGQRFDLQVSRGLNPLGLGQTEKFLSNLARELDEAAVSGVRDVAFAAAYAPARITRRAYLPDAVALSEEALRLFDVVYRSAARAPASEVARVVKSKVPTHLYELAEYELAARIESWDASPEERRKAEEFLRQVFAAFNYLMKSMIELKDAETLRETDLLWSGIFQYWTPEYEEPLGLSVDRLANQHGEDAPEVLAERNREHVKLQMASIKERLTRQRTTYRYGLCFWALRRLLGERVTEEWTLLFEHLRSHFSSVEMIVEGASLAFAAEAERDGVRWSDWILHDLPPGPGGVRGGAVGASSEILRAFVTLLLMSDDLEAQASSVGPLEWLPVRLEEAERLLDEVSSNQTLQESLLRDARFEQRSETVQELLRRSAQLQKDLEEREIRESTLSPEKVEDFESKVREAWSRSRLAAPLFQLAEAYEEPDEDPPGGENWFEFDGWTLKSVLVPEPEVYGGEVIAQHIGSEFANAEVWELLAKLSDSPQKQQASGSITDKIRATLRSMREDNLEPSAILVAPPFRFKSVEFDVAESGGLSSLPAGTPEGVIRYFLGRIEDVPIFRSLYIPENQACVIDLAHFATWRQWRIGDDGDLLSIETKVFTEEEALNLAREHPDLISNLQHLSDEDRAAQIRARARVRVREPIEIRISNQNAAVRVDISEGPT